MIKKKFPMTSTKKMTMLLVQSDQIFYFKVRPYRKFVKVVAYTTTKTTSTTTQRQQQQQQQQQQQ